MVEILAAEIGHKNLLANPSSFHQRFDWKFVLHTVRRPHVPRGLRTIAHPGVRNRTNISNWQKNTHRTLRRIRRQLRYVAGLGRGWESSQVRLQFKIVTCSECIGVCNRPVPQSGCHKVAS